MQAQDGTFPQELLNDRDAGSSADVVCPRLKSQTQNSQRLPGQHPKRLPDLPYKKFNSTLINPFDFLQERKVHSMFIRQIDESAQVLWQTIPSKANPCAEEFRPNSRVHAEALLHLRDIRPHCLAKISHHIDEGDLCSQERIGSVLNEFCRI